jgi:hypothetical protein
VTSDVVTSVVTLHDRVTRGVTNDRVTDDRVTDDRTVPPLHRSVRCVRNGASHSAGVVALREASDPTSGTIDVRDVLLVL